MKLCQKCDQPVAEENTTCPSCGSVISGGRKYIDDYRIGDVLHNQGHFIPHLVLNDIGLGLGIVYGLGFFWLFNIMTAFTTEFIIGKVFGAALRTNQK
jgi:hypothetical protein